MQYAHLIEKCQPGGYTTQNEASKVVIKFRDRLVGGRFATVTVRCDDEVVSGVSGGEGRMKSNDMRMRDERMRGRDDDDGREGERTNTTNGQFRELGARMSTLPAVPSSRLLVLPIVLIIFRSINFLVVAVSILFTGMLVPTLFHGFV